jgi:hypothetical protein
MIDAARHALSDLGEVSNEELAAHLQKAYGLSVRPNIIPVLKAAVRDKANLEAWRRRAQERAKPAPTPAEVTPSQAPVGS